MSADVLVEAILLAVQPAIEQAINERVNVLVKKLKLDEKKVWAALCEGTVAEAKPKLPFKTTAKVVDGKPTLAAPVTGTVQKLVLVHNYSEKSFAVTSVIPDDTKNIKDHLKAMELKFNGKAKVGTAIWVGQLTKLATVEAKLKELGLKYRKLSLADYEKEVARSKPISTPQSQVDETENADGFDEPVEVEEELEATLNSASEEEPPKPKTKILAPTPKAKGVAKKAVALQAKKNKWGNNAHEGYIFEKLPLGSNGAKVDAVIGVQDIKAPATKKEYASILPLSDEDRAKCESNGWRTIDEESLLIIKKKDAKKYEVLSKILKGKASQEPVKKASVKVLKKKPVEEEAEPTEE